jgi:hypothetical protein
MVAVSFGLTTPLGGASVCADADASIAATIPATATVFAIFMSPRAQLLSSLKRQPTIV